MVNFKTLHVSSLAYMPALVSLKLNCTCSMLCSNFLGMMMLICIGTMLLFWPSACVFSSVIWLSFSVFGLFSCSTQVVLAQSEYCRFRASEWLPENQAKWPNFHMLLLCGKFMVIVLLAVRSNCEFFSFPTPSHSHCLWTLKIHEKMLFSPLLLRMVVIFRSGKRWSLILSFSSHCMIRFSLP